MHNGWTNYETWLTALWFEEVFQQTDIDTIEKLANFIEEYVDENNPLQETSGLYCDLLSADLSMINYREIAKHILED